MTPLDVLMALAPCLAPWTTQDPAPAPEPYRIFGVVVDEANQPLEGVKVSLNGAPAVAAPDEFFVGSSSWRNPAPIETGLDGNFSFAVEPPEAYRFLLSAQAAGFARIWRNLEPPATGGELNAGKLTLHREGVVVGYIVDSGGNLLTRGWSVKAVLSTLPHSSGMMSLSAQGRVDMESGQFRIEGLRPGTLWITASCGKSSTADVQVTTTAGKETAVELRFDGPDPARELVISIQTRLFPDARPAAGTVVAIAPDGTRHVLQPTPKSRQDWHVNDVGPGPYRVEIRDPRFADWTQDNVRPNSTVLAWLNGKAALRVRLQNDGAADPRSPLSTLDARDVQVTVVALDSRLGRAPTLLPRPTEAEPDVFRGLIVGDLVASISAPGWRATEVSIEGLQPGEIRDVEVTLTRAAHRAVPLSGRVVDTEGRPLAGVEVRARPASRQGQGGWGDSESEDYEVWDHNVDANGELVLTRTVAPGGLTKTDAAGRFTLTPDVEGALTVRADLGPWVELKTHLEFPATASVELIAPPMSRITARLLLPEGRDPDGFALMRVQRSLRSNGTTRARVVRDPWLPTTDGLYAARLMEHGPLVLRVLLTREQDSGQPWETVCDVEAGVMERAEHDLVLDLRELVPEDVLVTIDTTASVVAAGWTPRVLLERPSGADVDTQFATRSSRVDAADKGARLHAQLGAHPGDLQAAPDRAGLRLDVTRAGRGATGPGPCIYGDASGACADRVHPGC